jgi:hypothetical protein
MSTNSTDGGSGNQHLSRAEKLQKIKLKRKHPTGAPSAKNHGGEAGVEHRRAPLEPPARKKESMEFRRLQTSANGREYFENLDRPGETSWEVPAGATVQTQAPKTLNTSNVTGEENKNSKKLMRKETTSQRVANPMARVNRMFRRLETSIGGREYFENVNKPGQTTWEVPENAAVVNRKPVGKTTSSFNYSTTQEAPDPNHHHKGTTSRKLIEMSILTDELLLLPNVENGKNEEQELSSSFYKGPTCSLINAFRLFCGELCCCLFCFVYLHALLLLPRSLVHVILLLKLLFPYTSFHLQ